MISQDYNEQFDEYRKSRVLLGEYKYGSAKRNFVSGNVNALASCQLCIDKYKATGNTEYLCDAANYLMFEFTYPQKENAHFRATDSNESAGLVGMTEKEMERFQDESW